MRHVPEKELRERVYGESLCLLRPLRGRPCTSFRRSHFQADFVATEMFEKVNSALGRRIRDETEAEHAKLARKKYEDEIAVFADDLSSWELSDSSDTKSQSSAATSAGVNSGMFRGGKLR